MNAIPNFALACAAILCLGNTAAFAQQGSLAEMVVDELSNPFGIAIQPETGDVFVADSGALRVLRIVDGAVQNVITGFAKRKYREDLSYVAGPVSLAFLSPGTLVVGGGDSNSEQVLRSFAIPAAGADAIQIEDAKSAANFPAEADTSGGGDLHALVVIANSVYATCSKNDRNGCVARATTDDEKITGFDRLIEIKDVAAATAPSALAVEPNDKQLAVGLAGKVGVSGDSRLAFYSPTSRRMLASFETGLSNITGLAYSPDKELYAIDSSWHDPKAGGLFQLTSRLEDGQQVVVARKIVSLDKPTALAFDAEGALYVTEIGAGVEGSDKPTGRLLKFPAASLVTQE